MVTKSVDAVELVLQILLKYDQALNLEEKEIDIQDLREVTNKYIEENQISEIVSQIINEAIKLFEDLRNLEGE